MPTKMSQSLGQVADVRDVETLQDQSCAPLHRRLGHVLGNKRLATVCLVLSVLFASLIEGRTFAAGNDQFSKAIQERRETILSAMDARFLTHMSPKFRSYDILGLTAANGCGPREYADYMSVLLDYDKVLPKAPLQPELFSLPPLVRYLYQFGECLDAGQKSRIAEHLSQNWDFLFHGTINHASVETTSVYLLAQYFPDLVWHNNGKTYSSAQVMAATKDLLVRRYRKFFGDGEMEQFSPTYTMANFYPLLNLIDFSKDAEMKSLAEASATMMLAKMRANSFHGTLVPPLSRVAHEQHNAPAISAGLDVAVGQQVLWFYFGEPQQRLLDIQNRREPVYVIMLALSKWVPPSAVLGLARIQGKPYDISTVTPNFSKWDAPTSPEMFGLSHIEDEFAIGAGAVNFDPAILNYHTQTFGIYFKSADIYNYVECYHPYWLSNAGEDVWRTDRSSPFEQVFSSGRRGVLIFEIPDRDPWQYDEKNRFFKERSKHKESLLKLAQCRFPKALDEVDVRAEVAFLRKGNVMIALRTLKGSNELLANPPSMPDFTVLKIREARTAIYFRVALLADGRSFVQFKNDFMNDTVVYDPNDSRVDYVDDQQRRVSVKSDLLDLPLGRVGAVPRVTIDGVPYQHSLRTVDTPFLRSGPDGFFLSNSDASLSIQLNDRLPEMKTSTTAGASKK